MAAQGLDNIITAFPGIVQSAAGSVEAEVVEMEVEMSKVEDEEAGTSSATRSATNGEIQVHDFFGAFEEEGTTRWTRGVSSLASVEGEVML